MCVPLAQARNSLGEAELIRVTKVNGWGLDLPTPAPVLVGLIAVATPNDQSSTRMVFGRSASASSPGIPSTARKKLLPGSEGTVTASAESGVPSTRPPRVPARRERREAACWVMVTPRCGDPCLTIVASPEGVEAHQRSGV